MKILGGLIGAFSSVILTLAWVVLMLKLWDWIVLDLIARFG